MKRRDLIRRVADAAQAAGFTWLLLRQGGDHEVWALDGKRVTIPRHSEINERTAEGICKSFEDKLGARWWK